MPSEATETPTTMPIALLRDLAVWLSIMSMPAEAASMLCTPPKSRRIWLIAALLKTGSSCCLSAAWLMLSRTPRSMTEAWGPLAWTIIFGLTFSTFLTLIIVPAMYYAVERIKLRIAGKLHLAEAEGNPG